MAALFVLALATRTPVADAQESEGDDVFVTERAAPLLDSPDVRSHVLLRLEPGTRGLLLDAVPGFRRVRLARSEGDEAIGWLRDADAATFAASEAASRELLAIGRFLVRSPSRRDFGIRVLSRACERLRAANAPDAASEVLLAEEVERSGRPAAGLFAAAFELRPGAPPEDPLRVRAEAGILRARYPKPAEGLTALWQETAAWLDLAERAREPEALAPAAERLGLAALGLGRLLVASARLEEVDGLRARCEKSAERLAALPGAGPAAKRLAGRARLLAAMRGDGTPPFPQRVAWGAGPSPLLVTIEGDLGRLELVVRRAGAPAAARTGSDVVRREPLPLLPVPGSLRLSPDGRTAAWLEVSAPNVVSPMVVALDGPATSADAALRAGGRTARDRARGHVVSRITGFSKDGRRVAVETLAWDDAPPEATRLAVLSTRTGDAVLEASSLPGGKARVRRALR